MPASKGNCGGSCGCNKCQYRIECSECCCCVPRSICILLTNAEGGCTCELARAKFDCSGGGTYAGTVTCENVSLDLTFTIEKVGEDCYLFLASDCLNLSGSERPSSQIVSAPGKCPDISAMFSVSGGSGTGTFNHCGDVNCSAFDITVSTPDRTPIKRECGDACVNCTCLSSVLCAELTYDGCDTATGILTYDTTLESWRGIVVCDVTGDRHFISFSIADVEDVCTITAFIRGDVIGTGTGPTNTTLTGTWDGECTAFNTTLSDDDYSLSIESNDCGTCGPLVAEDCCTLTVLGNTVTAVVDGDNGCAGFTGDSGVLTGSEEEGEWNGTFAGCEGTWTLRLYRLYLGTSSSCLELEFSLDGDCGGFGSVPGNAADGEEDCLLFRPFNIDATAPGCDCCTEAEFDMAIEIIDGAA